MAKLFKERQDWSPMFDEAVQGAIEVQELDPSQKYRGIDVSQCEEKPVLVRVDGQDVCILDYYGGSVSHPLQKEKVIHYFTREHGKVYHCPYCWGFNNDAAIVVGGDPGDDTDGSTPDPCISCQTMIEELIDEPYFTREDNEYEADPNDKEDLLRAVLFDILYVINPSLIYANDSIDGYYINDPLDDLGEEV